MIEKLRIEAASVISTRTGALLLEKFERLFESVRELLFGTPAKLPLRARRRYDGALLFAGTRRRVLRLGREIGDSRKRGIEIVHVGLDAGADVERDSRRARFRRRDHGPHHVADVNVVARLGAVAINRHGLAVEDSSAEDRNYAGFAVRILARAVYVAEAQRQVVDSILDLVKKQIGFGRQLGDAVGTYRAARMVLGARELVLLAVNRAAGRRKDHAPQAVAACRFDQLDKSDHVHLRIERRIGDR